MSPSRLLIPLALLTTAAAAARFAPTTPPRPASLSLASDAPAMARPIPPAPARAPDAAPSRTIHASHAPHPETSDACARRAVVAEFLPFQERLGGIAWFEESRYFNPSGSPLDAARRQELEHLIAAFNIELEDLGSQLEALKDRHIADKIAAGQYALAGGEIRSTRHPDTLFTGLRYLDASTAVRVEIRRGEFAEIDANLARESLLKERARQLIHDLFHRLPS